MSKSQSKLPSASAASSVEPLASKLTDWPTVGFEGERSKVALGGALTLIVSNTTAVSEVASVTTIRTVRVPLLE